MRLLGELSVTLLERIDAAFRIDHRLLTREVRMARRTGVDRHRLLRGARLDDIATRTGDRCLFVSRMDVLFHFFVFPCSKLNAYYTLSLANAQVRIFNVRIGAYIMVY